MPLRLVLWLVVPCLLGGGIGAFVLEHEAAPAGTAVAAPRMAPIRHASLPPRRVYRPVRSHPGLVSLGPSTEAGSLQAAGATISGAEAAESPQGDVVGFTPGSREFNSAVEAQQLPTETTTFNAPSAATTTTTPVSTEPILISDVHTLSLTPFSATIAWRTSEPVASRVAYGFGAPTLWTAETDADVEHVAEVSGLAFSSSYELWVTAHSEDGRRATAPFLLTTPTLSGPVSASTGGGAFQLNEHPFFPTIVWNACPDALPRLLGIGIDIFMANACGAVSEQATALGRRGFALSDALEAPDPAAIGSFLPDEWDTHLSGGLTAAEAHKLAPDRGGGPRFLTLTNHFYSHAEPLPQGRGMYPALVDTADVVGFDLYPLQNWCRWQSFGDVFESQRELVQLAAGRPTFQWIEARRMDCQDPVLDPSPDTVRAETWLAIAGGAHAIGYFPNDWALAVDAEIARTKREIQTLLPALLEPALAAQTTNPQLKVSARIHNGALYVIAVNATRTPATSTINVPLLGDRALVSLAGDRATVAAGGAFSDAFAPLEVRVYVSAPTP